ncbi:MAG: gamma-glutamyltransferase [Geodermatophilaceae bacterium]|nr:gamma-glutamyltransferase [Geodermatophilaceae bacterium]
MQTPVAVAAPSRLAAEAALRAAALGGSAVDAATAAALVAMVSEPGVVSLTGGAYLTLWPPGAPDAVVVDGYVAMPGIGRAAGPVSVREIRTDYGGGLTMTAGHGSVAVPGALAALDLAVSRWGRLTWSEVMAPAYEAARDGFPLGSASGYYLPYVRESLFAWDVETAAALRAPHGDWVRPGEPMVVPHLADTLAHIGAEGARSLYQGDLGRRLAADMTDRGGLVTAADLAAYRPLVRMALPVEVGGWSLRTNPAPAIGGAVLAAMLTLLDGDTSPARILHAQRRVLDIRRHSLDLADDRDAAVAALLRDVGWSGPTAPSTVHVSVVSADGGACAITASSGYGSGATLPGTGLWLNNCLGELELTRGAPLAPGTRLRSNMAPTVGRSADGGVLAIGSPGADRITTALLQVLAPFALDGTSLSEAVDRPRLHVHHLADDHVQVEAEEDTPLPAAGADAVTLPDGRRMPVRRHHRHAMYFGGVGAALRGEDGMLSAAADPRRAGAALTG